MAPIQVAFLSRHHQVTPDVSKKGMQQFLADCRASLVTVLDRHAGEGVEVLSPDRPPFEQAFMDLAYSLSIPGVVLRRDPHALSPVAPNQRAVLVPEGETFEDYVNGLPGITYLLHHQVQLLVPPALRRATYVRV